MVIGRDWYRRRRWRRQQRRGGGAGGSFRESARRSGIWAIIGTRVVEFAYAVHFSSGVVGDGVKGKKCENVIKLVLRPFSSSAVVGGWVKILTSLSGPMVSFREMKKIHTIGFPWSTFNQWEESLVGRVVYICEKRVIYCQCAIE